MTNGQDRARHHLARWRGRRLQLTRHYCEGKIKCLHSCSALVLEFNFQIVLTENVEKVTTDKGEASDEGNVEKAGAVNLCFSVCFVLLLQVEHGVGAF